MTQTQLLKEIKKSMSKMDEEDKHHFTEIVEQLMQCYFKKDYRAAIFICQEDIEFASLLCINADEDQLNELIIFVNALRGIPGPFDDKQPVLLN